MATTNTATQLHQRIVVALVRYFEQQGWKVTAAACQGYPDPQKVGRHEPDVVACDSRRVVVYEEAKTGNGDLDTQHSREQYHDFSSRHMRNTGTPCPFYLCVPARHKPDLERVLTEEGLIHKTNIHIVTSG